MSIISSEMVRELRVKTQAKVISCKEALEACSGDMEKAIEYLRKEGLADYEVHNDRPAVEGEIHSYIHANGKIGVMVEVNCSTDFAAKTDLFKEFVHKVALQVAAYNPTWLDVEEIPVSVIEQESAIYKDQLLKEGKPEKIVGNIIKGKLNKWYQKTCLLKQEYAFDDNKRSIGDLAKEVSSKLGEPVRVRWFLRRELGSGLDKPAHDFALEVDKELSKEKVS